MVKEVKVFQTSDGKTFKTKQGAENHEKKIEVAKAVARLGMTKDEIAKALQRVASHNSTIRMLLNHEPNWEKWYINHIRQINANLLKEPEKKTIYVLEYYSWGIKEIELAVETGEEFADPEKYCDSFDEKYKVVKVEQIDDHTMKVFYDYKDTWEERIKAKLEAGEDLSEDEISSMVHELPQVHEEEGDEGRWERYMTTVVDLLGDYYAIDWSRGLTESQENSYYEQPYKVKVETKEVVVKKTFITPIE